MQAQIFSTLYSKLERVKQECLDNKQSDDGCLMTVGLLPGSGKTFGIIQFISQRLVTDPGFRAVYITNQNKNLHPEKFYNQIGQAYVQKHGSFLNDNARQHYLIHHVAIIRSLPDSVGHLLSADLPLDFNTTKIIDSRSQLESAYTAYQTISSIDSQDSLSYQRLVSAELKFRQELWRQLATDAQMSLPLSSHDLHDLKVKTLEQDSATVDWLRAYFPTIDLEHTQLIIVNTAKALRRYYPFFSTRAKPVCNPQTTLKKAFIVLDELDSMKQVITQTIINNAYRLPVDFLRLFKRLHQELNVPQKTRPLELMQIFRKNQRYAKLLSRVNQLAQTYRLDLEYKNADTPVADNFIFHLPDFTLTNANKPWQSQLDLQKPHGPRVALSQFCNNNHQDLRFYNMLRQMTAFMTDFTNLVGKWAISYQQQENKRQSSANDLTVVDAMTTIYTNFFHLSLSETHNLINLWDDQFHSQSMPQDKSAKRIINQHHLQQSGAQFFNLIDRPDHHIATNIDAIFIKKTAEKFLLKLAKHNLVLGLSATVNMETVISNFDFNYLRGRLGHRLLDGRDYLSQAELDELDVAKRCRQHQVQVQITEAEGQLEGPDGTPGLTLILKKQLSPKAYDQLNPKGLTVLNQQFSQEIKARQATSDFETRRYLKLFESFVIFLKDSTLTSFLGLQTLLPKSAHEIGANPMRTEFIRDIFNGLENLLSSDERNRPQLCIIAKHSDKHQSVEEQLKAALQLPENQATRVFLLSAYNTLGVGMNLQHQLGSFERGSVINIAPANTSKNDQRQKQVDLSGIYLGDVTQIFEHVSAIRELTSQNIHYLLQLCYLIDNNEISALAVKNHLQRLNRGIHDRQFRDTLSYIWAYTRTILQALGRMDRTYNKTPTLQAVVDSNVLDYFNVQGLRPYQQGPVAQALQQLCETNRNTQLTPELIKYNQWNEFIQQTQKTIVQKLVPNLQKDTKAASRYQALREYLLAHPTISEWEYRKIQLKAGYEYLPIAGSAYRVQRQGDHFKFTPNGNELISASTAQLASVLAYPGMRDYFRTKHWALSWESRDYILNPVHFDSYLGILGEKAGQFILHDIWSIQIEKLSGNLNELFDARIADTHTLIDYKNWHQVHRRSLEREHQTIYQKLERVRQETGYSDWKVLFVNLIQVDSSQDFVQRVSENGTLLEVPALLDSTGQLALTIEEQKQIGAFIQ